MRDTSAGISFFDVRDILRRVGRAHGGQCSVQLFVPVREELRNAVEVRVRFLRPGRGKPGDVYERATGGPFPTQQSRTLAGMIFRLAHELDAKLTEEEEAGARERQAPLF